MNPSRARLASGRLFSPPLLEKEDGIQIASNGLGMSHRRRRELVFTWRSDLLSSPSSKMELLSI